VRRDADALLLQDNYLIEVRGDVQESLPSVDEDGNPSQSDGVRVYYMVHPSVDADESETV
jgi:DNA replication licensing factor MCM6